MVSLLRKKPAASPTPPADDTTPAVEVKTTNGAAPQASIERGQMNFPALGQPMIVCGNLVRIYKVAELEAVALQGLDLTVSRGEVMAIIGNSGSGKSTLLNIL